MPRYDHAEVRASGLNISKFASHYHQLWSWNACEWIIFSIGFDAGLRLSRMSRRDHAELRATGFNISLPITISFGAGMHVSIIIFTIGFIAGVRLTRFFLPSDIKSNST